MAIRSGSVRIYFNVSEKQIPIIFENTHYFIVNKPPGIPSQPPDCRTWGRTHPNLDPTPLLERFKAIYYSHREVELCRTVHRLDHCVTGDADCKD